ncbi:MAG: hypothetical protein COR54_19780, partial [Elusimicrobia bacterium CG22_combo_CG10-13_8_21_14_all_63_91]
RMSAAPDAIGRRQGLKMTLGGMIGLTLCMDASLYLRARQTAQHAAEHAAPHAPFWMSFPGFELVFGVLAAFALGLVAKLILFPLLKRDENYYDDAPAEET